MSITKSTPERLIKDKHIIREGITLNYWCYIGPITRVSKSRVYYIPMRYSQREGWIQDGLEQYISVSSVCAIADTADEARSFCLKWRERDDDIWAKYRADVKDLIKKRMEEINE